MSTRAANTLAAKDAEIEALRAKLAAVQASEVPGLSVKVNTGEERVKYGKFTLVKTFANGYVRRFGLADDEAARAVIDGLTEALG